MEKSIYVTITKYLKYLSEFEIIGLHFIKK